MSLTEELKADDVQDRNPDYAEWPANVRAIFEQAETVCREADAETQRLRAENERLRAENDRLRAFVAPLVNVEGLVQ